MFSSNSSLGRRAINPDGTRNVYCGTCGEFIASTTMAMSRAECALCERVRLGLPITEEFLTTYKLSKGVQADVSMVILPLLQKHEKTFSLRSLAGDFIRAIAPKKDKAAPLASKQIAQKKRRARLFDNIDLDTEVKPGE